MAPPVPQCQATMDVPCSDSAPKQTKCRHAVLRDSADQPIVPVNPVLLAMIPHWSIQASWPLLCVGHRKGRNAGEQTVLHMTVLSHFCTCCKVQYPAQETRPTAAASTSIETPAAGMSVLEGLIQLDPPDVNGVKQPLPAPATLQFWLTSSTAQTWQQGYHPGLKRWQICHPASHQCARGQAHESPPPLPGCSRSPEETVSHQEKSRSQHWHM
ncbi:hypothetical protein HYDPIDRAFT_116963 [Hydnomerulius pinastri MD-312]|uniref:Uncharacterized protein n=1 Tax=Hydnomerulius pinastri MD-312 TaxID=994086 RepID=A0A0C9WAT1_9AGAM|nr:hypothetical protein HYDPIDRAFT_116963 [Hydnomerulius pinastri MD-312]